MHGQRLSKAKHRLRDDLGLILFTPQAIDKFWSRHLYLKFVGINLKDSSGVKPQHVWISEGTKILHGRDYVNCIKACINALSTRSRTSRGRQCDRACTAGCGRIETISPVVQQCHRTNDAWVRRHDCAVKYVASRLKRQQYIVEC